MSLERAPVERLTLLARFDSANAVSIWRLTFMTLLADFSAATFSARISPERCLV